MMESKYCDKYVVGVSTFMKFVRDNMGEQSKIRCPCRDCLNVFTRCQDEVEDHLLFKGISESYTKWVYHSEQSDFMIPTFGNQDNGKTTSYEKMIANDGPLDDGMYDMLEDVFPRLDENETEDGLNFSS